jgi:hypothetical protein
MALTKDSDLLSILIEFANILEERLGMPIDSPEEEAYLVEELTKTRRKIARQQAARQRRAAQEEFDQKPAELLAKQLAQEDSDQKFAELLAQEDSDQKSAELLAKQLAQEYSDQKFAELLAQEDSDQKLAELLAKQLAQEYSDQKFAEQLAQKNAAHEKVLECVVVEQPNGDLSVSCPVCRQQYTIELNCGIITCLAIYTGNPDHPIQVPPHSSRAQVDAFLAEHESDGMRTIGCGQQFQVYREDGSYKTRVCSGL